MTPGSSGFGSTRLDNVPALTSQRETSRLNCGGVGGSLVNDQVADYARIRVEDQPGSLGIGSRIRRAEPWSSDFCRIEHRCAQTSEGLVGSAVGFLPRLEVITGTVHSPQTE